MGVYVHVPFCGNACDYCAFYKEEPRREHIEAWLDGIEKELALLPFPRQAATCYVGGGTPGVLSSRHLEKLCEILIRANGGNAFEEFTIELAPATVKPDKLEILRSRGVNRLSMGVQSFDETTLKILGRRHSPSQIFRAFEMMRNAGFGNVNFDLIFAVPTENPKRWEQDLKQAVALAPEHLSAYCLILEENAPLFARLKKLPDFIPGEKSPEREAELYLQTWETLARAGYRQYEVANHARGNAFRCRHNLNTWRMNEWIGYGPAAASQCFGKRFANPSNLKIWLENVSRKHLFHNDEQELSPKQLFEDALIFGLRLNDGVNLEKTAKRFLGSAVVPAALTEFLNDLRNENYLNESVPEGTLALSPRGLLVADAVAAEILFLMEN